MNREPRGRALSALTGAVIILTASLGSVLAANIAIGNSDNTTEFGQGEFTLKACDSWIQLGLVSGATGQNGAPSGLSALTGITIQGLDASQCKSTQFTIRAVDASANPLPIFRTDGETSLCGSTPCTIGSNSESDLVVKVSASGVVALNSSNPYRSLTFDDTLGVYQISFTQPGQLARDITDITIQSASL
jgi:hypothetical protein